MGLSRMWLRIIVGAFISSVATLHFMEAGLPFLDYFLVFMAIFMVFLVIDLLVTTFFGSS